MRKKMNLRSWVMGAVLFLSTAVAFAQTPTTNLTTREPTVAPPAGTTLEWHIGPLSSSPMVATPAAVGVGLYYGFYNYGSGCYSEPTPVRVLSNSCPTATTDLNNAVNADPTLSFHNALPVSDANAITGTAITQAGAGTYYVAYKTTVDGASCYSDAYPIVVLNTSCNPTANLNVVLVANNGTPLSIDVKANDTNPDGTAVTDFTKSSKPVITVQPSSGTATVNATDGSISYTPAAGFQGTVSLIYEICSVASPTACDTALVTIKVTPTIVANPDNVAVIAGTTQNIVVLSNDLNSAAAASLTNTNLATITQAPTKGTVTVKADGSIDYIANASATGTDVFIYQICDKTTPSVCDTALVTITLSATPVVVTTPSIITGLISSTIIGNVPSATGGTGAYSYAVDPTCTAPSGYTSLTAAGGIINGLNATTGVHTVTAPSAVGNYYYCIKVCDASGTNCAVSIHKVIVTATVTPVAVTVPPTITGVIGTIITGNIPNATGGTSPYTYSNGSSDPGCVTPSGHTALATAGGTINGLNTSTGAHTITAPNAVGNYYYCIKVCDTSGTNCAVSIHKVTATAAACNAGYSSPKIVKN